ncbi:hypothetical protein KKG90_10895 [Candidatus Bipolaricaulota bacterium]|nr:hypothetical protein [Candidatus Bipolaricaulota bacterium]
MHIIIRRLIAVGLILIAVSMTAAAHKPISIGGVFPTYDQALKMTNIDVSQVVYSPLNNANAQLWLVFQADEDSRLDVSLGVPVLDRLEGYRPNLAVLGPGLPGLDLGFETPENVGGVMFQSASAQLRREFYEPFTGTNSWILIEEAITLPEAGTYYVVAWPSGEQIDKLWVAIGKREEFGFSDFATFPRIVHDARAFHEVSEPHWLSTASKIAFLGVAAVLILTLAF